MADSVKAFFKKPLIRILAAQFIVAAAIFGVLLSLRGAENPAIKNAYGTVIKAFRYNIPVAGDEDDDIGKIKFVDKIRAGQTAVDAAPVEIVVPVSSAVSVSGKAGVFEISGAGGMVVACERGIVSAAGFQSGVKYIEISHTGGIKSRCYGVAAAGVKIGESVIKGQYIGTVDGGGTLTFCLLKDNAVITAAVYVEGRFQW